MRRRARRCSSASQRSPRGRTNSPSRISSSMRHYRRWSEYRCVARAFQAKAVGESPNGLESVSMHRIFVALRPPLAMREALLALRTGLPGARWQTDEQLHLTLRFVGEVDRPEAEDVAAALGTVDGPAPQIAL